MFRKKIQIISFNKIIKKTVLFGKFLKLLWFLQNQTVIKKNRRNQNLTV